MPNVTPVMVVMLLAELTPAAIFGFASAQAAEKISRWPVPVRLVAPSSLALLYGALAWSQHMFSWRWFALYAVLPVGMAWLMEQAAATDPEQHGSWRDALILVTLGLAVDLRWFDVAWPAGMRGLGNLLLVDAGLYAFLGVRRLSGTGFDFYLRWSDWKTGLRELMWFAPLVLGLGIALGFIHPHASLPVLWKAASVWAGIFLFVAVPEELFFRAWIQNLLERRLGRWAALIVTAILFGLSHFNKRSTHFNWQYVLLASIAGIFYGRAWRQDRRVPASAITHTFVDWLWVWWF